VGVASLLGLDNPLKPDEQGHGRSSLGQNLDAPVTRRTPLEGRVEVPHETVEVIDVGPGHGKNLTTLVHPIPDESRLPRGGRDVEPPSIAMAADENVEAGRFRDHSEGPVEGSSGSWSTRGQPLDGETSLRS
jgi:hypothetical protein